MVDIFFEKLSQLNDNEDIFVFWDGDGSENGFGTMYINDESKHQAQEITTLFEAYKFAILINACNFDYVASDELVKKFGKQLLDLVDDEFYKIDIWDYFDDIAQDFKKLTGITIDDLDERHIVSCMSEISETECGLGFGSATYIARMLSDYIEKCNNPIAKKLVDEYLQIGEYDLYAFAKALHNTIKEEYIAINGYIWINNCKYESVTHILVTNEEVDIYIANNRIGSILRENINTFLVGDYDNYSDNYDINQKLNFDIKKIGDF